MRPAESRAVALLLLVLTLLLFACGLGIPWWFVGAHLRMSNEMSDLREQQARYVGIIAQRSQVQAQLDIIQQEKDEERAFLPEADANAATAGLMQRVTESVQQHASEGSGCELTQKTPISRTKDDEPYQRVSVSITLQCGSQPLGSVLYDLEGGPSLLFLDEFSAFRAPAGYGASAKPSRAEVQFVLSGYIRSMVVVKKP